MKLHAPRSSSLQLFLGALSGPLLQGGAGDVARRRGLAGQGKPPRGEASGELHGVLLGLGLSSSSNGFGLEVG